MPLPLTVIAAVAQNGIIGRGNRLPWQLPGDLAHFRACTMGRPVIIGRRTYDSIGGPLSGRPIIVLSRDPGFSPATGAVAVGSVEIAIEAANEIGASAGAPEIIVAGGSAVYAAFLPRAKTLLLTEVHLDIDGDTAFPQIDPTVWREVERTTTLPHPDDTATYAFVRLSRMF